MAKENSNAENKDFNSRLYYLVLCSKPLTNNHADQTTRASITKFNSCFTITDKSPKSKRVRAVVKAEAAAAEIASLAEDTP